MTYTLPHHETAHQRRVNNIWSCILGNQGIALIQELITTPMTSIIGNNTIYERKITDSKIIGITKGKPCKKRLPVYIRDFDKILLLHRKSISLIWLYRLTGWQPAKFRLVGIIQLNRTRVDGFGVLTTKTANLATVWFEPGPRPEATVWNHC